VVVLPNQIAKKELVDKAELEALEIISDHEFSCKYYRHLPTTEDFDLYLPMTEEKRLLIPEEWYMRTKLHVK